MKNCRHCFEEIHSKARICPHCNRANTLIGGVSVVLFNVVSVLLAFGSLALAYCEKMEKHVAQQQLQIADSENYAAQELLSQVPTASLETMYREQAEDPSVDLDPQTVQKKLTEVQQRAPAARAASKAVAPTKDQEFMKAKKQEILLRSLHTQGRRRTVPRY